MVDEGDHGALPASGRTSSDSVRVANARSAFSVPAAWLHAAAVLWTVILAVLVLAPALSRGWMLGPYDLLAQKGLTVRPGVVVHGSYTNSDLISEMIPWTNLNWIQVHHGTLPLCNPYNGLGLPLAFNWQSASFAVPSLIGYLFPLRDAYTVSVVLTLVIAGTGAYVLARVLRLGFLGALMTATVFELCGPLIGWLGYPHAQVMSWGGWLFAAGVLVVSGRRRVASVVFLAVVIACSVYAGQPETLAVMLIALGVFIIVLLFLRAAPVGLGFAAGPIRRPVTDLVLALGAGLALAAPLLLPGAQATGASGRGYAIANQNLPVHYLTYLLFSGFDGVPVPGNFAFGASLFYNQTAAYIGVIVLVLAAIALAAGWRRRRPEVLAIAASAVVMAALVFVGVVARVLSHVPVINEVALLRALMPLGLCLAVLAGIGLEAVLRSRDRRAVSMSLLAGFGFFALVLGGLWFFDRVPGLSPALRSYESYATHVRVENFVWPVAGVAIGLVAAGVVWWLPRLRVLAAIGLLAGETAFLVLAGSVTIASSSNGFPATPAITALQRAVGGATVGSGQGASCLVGIIPEANDLYGVREVDAYDPIIPKASFTAWQRATRTVAGFPSANEFCPTIMSAAEARLLGVSYVLQPAGVPFAGGVFVTQLRTFQVRPPKVVGGRVVKTPYAQVGVNLYRIPGSGRATLFPVGAHQAAPPADAPGSPVAVDDSNPSKWIITTHADAPALLRLHLSDVPGWHATIDGTPLALEPVSGLMYQARVPPGRHMIEVAYWPTAFTVGLVLAGLTVLALVAALGVQLIVRRSREHDASA